MATPSSLMLPKERPPIEPSRGARARAGEASFDWVGLVSRVVHPIKVEIVEALLWIEQPLSASELTAILGEHSLGTVAYHLKELAKLEVIEVTDVRQVRGARESYFSFA